MIMDSNGAMYLSDDGNAKVWKCTGVVAGSAIGTGDCTDLSINAYGGYGKLAFDPTERFIYIIDYRFNQIGRCLVSFVPASCGVYLRPSTTIGYDLLNTAITPATTGFAGQQGITVDSTNNVVFYAGGEIYKCTAVDTCSLFMNGHAINPNADDDPSTISDSNYGLKFDSNGYL
jgi:hypothetical protein